MTAGKKSVVSIDCLADPESMCQPLVAVLTSDLLVLCKPPVGETSMDGFVDLYAVLRMQTKTQPASISNGSCTSSPRAPGSRRSVSRRALTALSDAALRVVDNRAILYFDCPSTSDALTWLNGLSAPLFSFLVFSVDRG